MDDEFICEECGDDLAAAGLRFCSDCLMKPAIGNLPEESLRRSP